jgi:hypothetical protein
MSAIKNDGSLTFSGVVLTIGGVSFYAETLTLTRPSKTFVTYGPEDEPIGQVTTRDVETISALIQISGKTPPALGATFEFQSKTYYISDDTLNVAAQQETKKTINARERLVTPAP